MKFRRWISRVIRPRRRLRRAILLVMRSDGCRWKLKMIYYHGVEIARWLGLPRKEIPEWTASLRGHRIHFNATVAELIPYKEIEVDRVYERSPEFRPGPNQIVFDVGANIGLFTLHAAGAIDGGTIFAFEPNPAAYSKLLMNIEDNRLQNVKPFPCAVGSTSGRAVMQLGGRTTLGKVIDQNEHGDEPVTGVPMVTLDEIVRRHEVPRIDLLKVDVEGHELEVLNGAREALKQTRRIVMEYEGAEFLARIRSFLEDQGFEQVLEYRGHAYFVRRNQGDRGAEGT